MLAGVLLVFSHASSLAAREPCQDITGTGIYSGVCPDALSGGSNSILYFNGSLFNAGGHTYTVLQFGRQLDTGTRAHLASSLLACLLTVECSPCFR